MSNGKLESKLNAKKNNFEYQIKELIFLTKNSDEKQTKNHHHLSIILKWIVIDYPRDREPTTGRRTNSPVD
jgi:hypothetical protein